jgi:outer membrane protein assembly complex protein YaeT
MKIDRFHRGGALLLLPILCAAGALRGQVPAPAPASGQAASAQESPGAAAPALAVVAVRIVTREGRILSEAPPGLPLVMGQPATVGALRESLRILYRTGNYQDLQVVETPVEGGARIDFLVRENLFFNQVRIEGLSAPPSEATAVASMQVNLGQVFRQSVLDEGLSHLREALAEEGLYEARVSAEPVPHAETRQMDVLVRVVAGPRARLGQIELLNHTGYPSAELLEQARLAAGRELTLRRLQTGSERIRKFLGKNGHLGARATVRRGPYDAAKKTVPLELEVNEGPRVRVDVSGAKFSRRALKKLIPIYQEGAIDPDLLEEGRHNLQERLENEGYFDAQVSYTTATNAFQKSGSTWKSEEEVVTYAIERGERHKVVGIEIAGNRYFSRELLRQRLRIQSAAFASPGRFSRRLLDDDAQSMLSLYQGNGFENARVTPVALDDFHGKNGAMLVRFQIEEGPQTKVSSLAIEGNRYFSQDELFSVIGSTPGQPFSEFNVISDRDNILALYFNEGFPQARFTAAVERSAADSPALPAQVRLTYRLEEGPQVRVRQVLIGGQHHARPAVIQREIRFRPGEPLRQGEVVESQRRLYNLGIFNRVAIEPQNSAGSDPQKNVSVLVEESKRYTLSYGGGVEVQRLASTTDPTGRQLRASPRGLLEISKANLSGRADSLALKIRGSTLQGRAQLIYSAPSTFGKDAMSFQAIASAERIQDISTFSVTRYEGTVQLTQVVSPLTSLLYRYAFRKVLVNQLKITAQEVPLFNQPTLISEFGLGWFRDRRDNPANATRGNFTSADTSIADTSIGSSASFLRFFIQNSSYYPLGRRFSFARSLRFGVLLPYRDTVSLSFPAPITPPLPTVIPLPERFFAGGGTSLRGFALNQAGPRDALTGFPVGGQAQLIFNQELRFPMRVPLFGTQLGGAFFYDAGNVFSRLKHISLRWKSPTPVFDPLNPTVCQYDCTNELDSFSHTLGFGVRYATPVGPIRVDIGYLLNPSTLVVPCPSGVPGCQQSATLPRLQLFFSLGAPF